MRRDLFGLLILLARGAGNDSPHARCHLNGGCETTYEITDIFSFLQIDQPCIFMSVDPSNDACDVHSAVRVLQKTSVPHTQLWSHCNYCGMMGRSVHIYSSETHLHSVDLSWSQWNGFFHHDSNDRFHANIYPAGQVADVHAVVTRPVYLLPLLTLQIGHVFVDLMEQVYHNMMDTYGSIRSDAVIVIDVANIDERRVIRTSLAALQRGDTPYIVLNLLSHIPILSFDGFSSFIGAGGLTLFDDLHIGLDISSSFINAGAIYQPMHAPLGFPGPNLHATAKKYILFQSWLRDHISVDGVVSAYAGPRVGEQIRVLVIIRAKNRAVVNIPDILRHIDTLYNAELIVTTLENVPFSRQYTIFNSVDIVVQAAGTNVHNLMFMSQRPLALVLIIQRGWCDWSWIYANQALLLGISVHVYCDEEAGDHPMKFRSTCFSRAAWQEGPAMYKSFNITVDIDKFSSVFASAVANLSADTEDPGSTKGYFESGLGLSIGSRQKMIPLDITYDMDNMLELFICKAFVAQLPGRIIWSIKIFVEIGLDRVVPGIEHLIFSSYPHLSMCIQTASSFSIPTEVELGALLCVEIYRMNYASWLTLSAFAPIVVVHGWLQSSPSGGKLQSSDVYVYIDARQQYEGGFNLIHCMVPACADSDSLTRFNAVDFTVPFMNASRAGSFTVKYDPQQWAVVDRSRPMHRILQSIIKRFCESSIYSEHQCIAYTVALSRCILINFLAAAEGLPPRQLLPSPQHPFIFLHIEKCAGTTFRNILEISARSLGLTYFVPCQGYVPCNVLSLSIDCYSTHRHNFSYCPRGIDYSNISVLAGHFSYNEWQVLPMWRGNTEATPACTIIGRHPVSRVISYFYQRCYEAPSCRGYHRRFNDLTDEDLSNLLVSLRGTIKMDDGSVAVIDEGVSDAACRAILGAKASTGLRVDINRPALPAPPELSEKDEVKAIRNVEHCVVGIQEQWNETKRVFAHWFPWIDLSQDDGVKRMQIYSELESIDTLRLSLRALIEDANRCDMALYEHMVYLFNKQMNIIDWDQ